MNKKSDFGLIFWTHLLLILAYWILPFLVDWLLVLLSVVIYYIQHFIFKYWIGNCPLTVMQFRTRDPYESFYHYYLTNYLGFGLDKKKVKFFITWILPWVILGLALVWQVGLGFNAPLF